MGVEPGHHAERIWLLDQHQSLCGEPTANLIRPLDALCLGHGTGPETGLVRDEIGRGSNGVVYSAHDPVLGREVAIKAVPLTTSPQYRQQVEAGFLNEARAAGRLSHPHIVTIFDAGKSGDLAYIAMERLHGRDLHDVLASGQ